MNKLNYEQALSYLAAYCSTGERCIFDVRRKMEKWKIPSVQQIEIIQKLQKENFLDEERYCKAFVNDKSQYNRWGNYKIRYELRKRQIPESLIRDSMETVNSEENLERLRQLIEQKKKSVKGKNEWEIWQKLIRFAVGRGFSQKEVELAFGKEIMGLEP